MPFVVLNSRFDFHTGVFASATGIQIDFDLGTLGSDFNVIVGAVATLGKKDIVDPVVGGLTGDVRFALEPNRDGEFPRSIQFIHVGKAQSIVIAVEINPFAELGIRPCRISNERTIRNPVLVTKNQILGQAPLVRKVALQKATVRVIENLFENQDFPNGKVSLACAVARCTDCENRGFGVKQKLVGGQVGEYFPHLTIQHDLRISIGRAGFQGMAEHVAFARRVNDVGFGPSVPVPARELVVPPFQRHGKLLASRRVSRRVTIDVLPRVVDVRDDDGDDLHGRSTRTEIDGIGVKPLVASEINDVFAIQITRTTSRTISGGPLSQSHPGSAFVRP